MTAKQAKELADSQAINLREVYQEIEDSAKRGEYSCRWYSHLNVMAVMELRANGYVVSDLGNIRDGECFKISWE